jgi:predicted RNA binding protein YcfA (HicA-like mRNA interferase family)
MHEGFQTVRQSGSHVILIKEGVRTVVPVHPGKDVKPGLVRAIIREAKLTRNRFFELLEKKCRRKHWKMTVKPSKPHAKIMSKSCLKLALKFP